MKMKYNRWLLMLMCASFAFTGCEKEDLPENGIEQGADNDTEVPEGYFVANLMPTTYDLSRGLVKGESTAIQSLRFLIFKKETDDDGKEKYMYYNPNNDASFGIVFEAENQSGLVNQTYTWPLQNTAVDGKLTVTLPVGDYRVVFLGNMMTNQFIGQADNSEIVYLSDGEYDNVRINLPSAGPQAFYPALTTTNDVYQNAFYMGSADFNINNPSPKIVLQRLLSQSCFSRDFIDTNEAVGMLVQSIVDQIKDGQLSTDIVKGVLRTNLTKILKPLLGNSLLYPLTTVVDRLVNILLGDLVNALHKAVLEQVTVLVNNELKSGSDNEAALYKILNPWSTVGSIDAKVALAESIDLNRRVKSYCNDPLLLEDIPVVKDEKGVQNFTITSLNGPFTLIEANVNDPQANGLNNAINILRPGVNQTDELLAGLLINIKTSLAYTQESNQRYTTKYDLLNLKLTDSSPEEDGETINVSTALSTVLDSEKLTQAILGDGILSGILSGLVGGVDELVNTILGNEETSLLENLDLRLPNIAIGNISLDGRWDVTRQADNTIIETEIGGYDN